MTTQIQPKFVPKVWGSTQLEPWFPNQAEKTGEVWFPAGELLIKFLFTTEPLSVQVHPDDAYAAQHENSRGKTEMWHILRAEPGAQVALGFKQALDPAAFRELCVSGEIMDHLAWHDAHAGDTFFTPAGTVHAIGAGLALCEIQENSDVTYRIYDYGRPRELHLERSMEVAETGPHAGASAALPVGEQHHELVRCGHFVTEKLRFSGKREIPGAGFVIVIDGEGTIDNQPFHAGTVWETAAGLVTVESRGEAVLLLTRAA